MGLEAALQNILHKHKCTVYRSTATKGSDNFTSNSAPAAVYTDIKCHRSLKSSSTFNAEQTEGVNEIRYDAKLFVVKDYVILVGDKVVVTVKGETETYKAGKGTVRSMLGTREIPLLLEGVA